jgi:DnaD/phage-associated family protein
MAEKRMFARGIIDSDMFLDMPATAQLLYFHLCMRADDDGFINNPKRIMRDVRCSEDDMKMLIAKEYIIPFESGIIVIRHWRLHNYIQKDRYKPSLCDEKNLLTVNKNKAYELLDTSCIQNVNKLDTDCTQSVLVDKYRVDKNREVESRLVKTNGQTDELQPLIEFCNTNVEWLTPYKLDMLEGYVTDFGIEWVQKGLEKLAGLDRSKQNMKYLGGVLEGWQKDGVPKPWEQKKYEPEDDYDPDNRASLWISG